VEDTSSSDDQRDDDDDTQRCITSDETRLQVEMPDDTYMTLFIVLTKAHRVQRVSLCVWVCAR
jgi:hypothetical protein